MKYISLDATRLLKDFMLKVIGQSDDCSEPIRVQLKVAPSTFNRYVQTTQRHIEKKLAEASHRSL